MNEVPRGITARRLIRALQQDGFLLSRTRGSHRIYRHLAGAESITAAHVAEAIQYRPRRLG